MGGSFAIRCTERTERCPSLLRWRSWRGPRLHHGLYGVPAHHRIILPRLPVVGSSPARKGGKMASVILDRAESREDRRQSFGNSHRVHLVGGLTGVGSVNALGSGRSGQQALVVGSRTTCCAWLAWRRVARPRLR
jgi:hypothetical protein